MKARSHSGIPARLSLWLSLSAIVIFGVMVIRSEYITRPPFKIRHSPHWREVADRKRIETFAKIPQEWLLDTATTAEAKGQRQISGAFVERLLDPETRAITILDGLDIVNRIANRSYTALEVTTAFCKRAAVSHQLNHCLLEIFFEDALRRAEELDEYQRRYNKTMGPLHGLPLSLKDQYHVPGADTTMGYVGWIGTFEGQKGTSEEDFIWSQPVEDLLHLGANPFVKTTVVQTLWFGETNNNILGYNFNPVNQLLSSGGSSGGEGSLQALKGSPAGLASDIGGSVAIPAAFCGVYSIKPSSGRISFRHVANSSRGQKIMPTVPGFMASSLRSLNLLMSSTLSTKPWLRDPGVIRLPWDADEASGATLHDRQLCLGIMATDGVVSPHPPILRGLRMIKESVRAAGSKVIRWSPPSHDEASKIHGVFTDADGGADVFKQLSLSGEPIIPQLEEYFHVVHPPLPLLDFYNATLWLEEYRERYLEYWNSTIEQTETGRAVDAIIIPVAPTAAVIPGKYYHYSKSPLSQGKVQAKSGRKLAYGSFANVLDYTTIVIPVTTVDKNIDVFDDKYAPLNHLDEKNWQAYDPKVYHGAPVGIQIVGRRLEEEKLLYIAQYIEDAMKANTATSKL